MEVTGKDYKASKRKMCIVSCCLFFALFLMFDQALARDGFRCMITGMINQKSLESNAALRDIAKRDGANMVKVNACYNLNESAMQGTDPAGISEESAVINKVRRHQ